MDLVASYFVHIPPDGSPQPCSDLEYALSLGYVECDFSVAARLRSARQASRPPSPIVQPIAINTPFPSESMFDALTGPPPVDALAPGQPWPDALKPGCIG